MLNLKSLTLRIPLPIVANLRILQTGDKLQFAGPSGAFTLSKSVRWDQKRGDRSELDSTQKFDDLRDG